MPTTHMYIYTNINNTHVHISVSKPPSMARQWPPEEETGPLFYSLWSHLAPCHINVAKLQIQTRERAHAQ